MKKKKSQMLEQFAEPSTANLRQILGQIDERRPGGERVARLVFRICQKYFFIPP